jgi:hypothetical protein
MIDSAHNSLIPEKPAAFINRSKEAMDILLNGEQLVLKTETPIEKHQ